MSEIKISEIIEAVNHAPKGSFIGITDYVSVSSEVSSITGQIGVSYENAKAKAIAAMEKAIADNDFEPLEVSGHCRQCPETGEYNSRKRTWPMTAFKKTFGSNEVKASTVEVLESFKNAERKTNKMQLSTQENAVYVEGKTHNVNVTVLVAKQTYKKDASDALKAEKGVETKVKATMPESALKTAIRKRFSPNFKSITLEADNFSKLTINGKTF